MKTVCAICMLAMSGASTPPAPDFSLSMDPSVQNVAAGAGATFTVTVAALNGPFVQPVLLEARGLPSGATVSFSPASVTPGARSATTTLTVRTVAQDAAILPRASAGLPATPVLALLWVLPFGVRRRTRYRLGRWTALIAAAGLLQGCEGGGAVPLTETIASQATYTMTVTGTAGATQHSVRTELVVQTGSGFNN
jgi:hypothetical protein